MIIKLSKLRSIIRETLKEQGWVPGRWYPGTGQPINRDEIDLMGSGGLGASAFHAGEFEEENLEEDEDEHVKESFLSEKKKKGLWANIWAKRRRGERPARPGDKGYPKTLDIEEAHDENTNE